MKDESDCESKHVLCCFSMSSNKKRKRRKLSQPHMNTSTPEGLNKNAFTSRNHNTNSRNTQLTNLPKEDLLHKFNSVRSSNELIITKQSDNSDTLHTMKYSSNNEGRVISKDNSDTNDMSSVYLVNDNKQSGDVYIKECQQTLSSLMDEGNELTSSKVISNLNASSMIKDNRLDISSYVISTNKMPSQQLKQHSSFHKSQKSLFSIMSSSSYSCFKQVQFELTAETSNKSIEGRKTVPEHNKVRCTSCSNKLQSGQHGKGLGYKLAKKIKEINGIKDKINEITNTVMQYEEETQNIIRTIEKEENDAQILIYMLNFLLNKQH